MQELKRTEYDLAATLSEWECMKSIDDGNPLIVKAAKECACIRTRTKRDEADGQIFRIKENYFQSDWLCVLESGNQNVFRLRLNILNLNQDTFLSWQR